MGPLLVVELHGPCFFHTEEQIEYIPPAFSFVKKAYLNGICVKSSVRVPIPVDLDRVLKVKVFRAQVVGTKMKMKTKTKMNMKMKIVIEAKLR